jgi:hypothetical protein
MLHELCCKIVSTSALDSPIARPAALEVGAITDIACMMRLAALEGFLPGAPGLHQPRLARIGEETSLLTYDGIVPDPVGKIGAHLGCSKSIWLSHERALVSCCDLDLDRPVRVGYRFRITRSQKITLFRT